jgi:8-oxo-dGTP pyrophosphatase MutT (NUDIX family)
MFSPGGGYDPESDNAELAMIEKMDDGPEKSAALAKYGEQSAAREILEELGLHLTELAYAGKALSNRSVYITDLKDQDHWYGEHVYVSVVDASALDASLAIALPEDKLGDVQPAPEWSGIKKLQFMPWADCFDTPDGVACMAYAKAYRWWMLNH